ncbi:MAG: hypothetical protein JXB88_00210 [Spirochaetales bacterium]|nr:hypothetical protein [Spirochaetales bacterium]
MMGYKNVIILFFYFFSSLFLYCTPPLIQNGYVDLSNYEFTDKLVLKGEYKFKYQDKEILVNVPGYWNNIINKEYGYCEYFLKLKIPKSKNLYLFMDHISTAYELYINNNLALKAGRIGKDRIESIPELKYAFISLPSTDIIQLHWKISNFHSNVGGIPYAPIIGPGNYIKNVMYTATWNC